MGKNSKRVLASAAALCLVLSSTPVLAADATTAPERFAGKGRVETAIKIAEASWKGNWKDSKTAVLAGWVNEADALAVAPLAYKLNAPILLNDAKDSINAETLATLKAQGVKKVYIATGTGVISDKAVESLKAEGMEVVRLGGGNRYETAKKIYDEFIKQGGKAETVALVNGLALPDALSVASIAAKQGMPILMTSGKDAVATDLQEVAKAAKKVYAVGGSGVISDALINEIKAERLGGSSRYETNAKVIKGFAKTVKFDKVYLANGANSHLVDALTGSVLAAQSESPIVLADGSLDSSVKEALKGNVNDKTSVVALGGDSVVTTGLVDAVKNANKEEVQGDLKVQSVSAISAKSFKVVFNKAVADTAKVKFDVKKNTAEMKLNPTWNEGKTEATLTFDANLPEGEYTIGVKNGEIDLGNSKVKIEKQKIAKIEIKSDTLAVAPIETGKASQGFASYRVFDQYNNDVTGQPIASSANINWQCGIGTTPVAKDGLLTITAPNANVSLTQYQNVNITAFAPNAGVSTSATLKVSLTQGTIKSIEFKGLKDNASKEILAGDVSKRHYIEFTAIDMSGNATDSYTLLEKGLFFQDKDQKTLVTGNSQLLTAKLVKNPANPEKGLIEVIPVTNYNVDILYQDQIVPVFAYTNIGGSQAKLDITVKKPSTLKSIALSAPTQTVSVGERVEIPFEAFDQNQKKLTKKSEIDPNSNLTSFVNGVYDNGDYTLELKEDVNGNLKIYGTFKREGLFYVSITAKNCMPAQMSLTVDKAAEVGGFTFNQDSVKSLMVKDATQKVDLGYFYGGLEVRDQYGKKATLIDTNIISDKQYCVEATSLNPDTIEVVDNQAVFGKAISFKAKKEGTATITFTLKSAPKNEAHPNYVETGYSATASFSVVKDDAIVDYTMDKVDTFYPAGTTIGRTAREKEFGAWLPDVFGKLSNGALVKLPDANISYSANGIFTADEDAWKVCADPTKMGTATEAKGILSATVTDVKGRIHAVSTEVVAKKEAPVVKEVGFDVKSIASGMPTGAVKDGDTVTVTAKAFNEKVLNKCLERYDANGSDADKALVSFYAKDQYGKGSVLNRVTVEESTDSKYEYKDGKLVLKAGKDQAAGDSIMVSAVYGSMISRVKIVVVGVLPEVPVGVVLGNTVETAKGVTGAAKKDAVPGTAGIYSVTIGTADVTIDGKTFTYNASTEAKKWKDATELVALINADDELKVKYTAAVDSAKVKLTQKVGHESATAPVVSGTGVSIQTTTAGKATETEVPAVVEVKEVGTTTVTTAAAKNATIKVNVTDGTLNKTVDVAVLKGDTAVVVAGKIRAALAADDQVKAAYDVTGADANIVLTQKGAGKDVVLAVTIQP